MRVTSFLCFILLFVSCKQTNKHLTKITAKTIAVDSTIASSSEIDSIITPYKNKMTAEMQQVLCYNPTDLVKNDGELQSSLGNLMADLCFENALPIFKEKTGKDIDFAMFNNGGIRATIPKGKVLTENAFKLMPFENELVAVEITGEKVVELIEYFLSGKKAHPLSKNIQLTVNERNKDYSLIINGKSFNKNNTYVVLTTDYLQGGGDKMVFFKNPEKLIKLDYKMRDAIIDHFKKVDTLKTSLDNRVIIK
ncbi:5'-nucleotidase C-terminal domain-containing protein [Tenacibaculum sp. M341]|uniref:5'-nucleotidase C-terminal domain-containing protein n=1 Tax=Tenacibaculum sp. M341 TaxID=2530339 RepID=UPI001050AB54|nr:5'-nucleotidase [Tenacibaculum sp. M341]TCI93185.1 UDP-sugar hydrolase [Tenacibaculum sp. M341]